MHSKPDIHRHGTLRGLHPALRFQSAAIFGGHRFVGSFADRESSSSETGSYGRSTVDSRIHRNPGYVSEKA